MLLLHSLYHTSEPFYEENTGEGEMVYLSNRLTNRDLDPACDATVAGARTPTSLSF